MDEGTHENRTVVYLNRGETFGVSWIVNMWYINLLTFLIIVESQ